MEQTRALAMALEDRLSVLGQERETHPKAQIRAGLLGLYSSVSWIKHWHATDPVCSHGRSETRYARQLDHRKGGLSIRKTARVSDYGTWVPCLVVCYLHSPELQVLQSDGISIHRPTQNVPCRDEFSCLPIIFLLFSYFLFNSFIGFFPF